MPWVVVIVSALSAAWSLISGAAAIAGAALLVKALSLIPSSPGGAAPADWLAVANAYLPINESVALFGSYLAISAAIFAARWTLLLKK